MLHICQYIWSVFVLFKLTRPYVLCNESYNIFCNTLCSKGVKRSWTLHKHSVTYSQLTSLQIHLNLSCFCGSTETSRTRGTLMFWSKMGWHVACIAGLVELVVIHSYFTYSFIFVGSVCLIYVDNIKSNVFLYVRLVVCKWIF
jgi:hypothetical protein